MYSTIRNLVSSVDLQLKQTSSESTIPLTQIYLWATYFINKYMSFKYQTTESGSYLSIFPSVSVIKSNSNVVPNIIAGEKYSILPRNIYDFPDDRGIDYITYSRSEYPDNVDLGYIGTFMRTSPSKAKRLYYSKYEKPSPANPYFYIHGNYVGYLGIKDLNISTVEMGLITTFDPFQDHDIDDNLPILYDFGDEIHKDMFEMGRFALLVPEDRIQDAASNINPEQVPQARAVSVNKQQTNQEQE
jgi:hypothetical protein